MKKLIHLIALSVACIACNHPQNKTTPGQIVINGSADKAYNGQSIIIRNRLINQVDTAEIINGHFRFKIPFKEAAPYHFYIYNKSKNSNLNSSCDILVAQPEVIAIKANVANLEESVVTGTSDNDLYKSFQKSETEITQQIDQKLVQKYGKDYTKHYEPEDSLYKEVLAYYEKLAKAFTINMDEFVQKNANSFAATYMLKTKVIEIDPDTLELLYNKLGNKYKKTLTAVFVANKIKAENATAIGKLAPDFEQADTSGKVVKLRSFRGKFVLIDFWASWCGPCRYEKPNLIKTYRRFHDKGFTVLGISLDREENKAKWLAAIHQDKLEWPQVADLRSPENRVAILYGVTAIPDNILIGPDGKIVAKDLSDEILNNKLQELLAAK
jgi:peroxiredoxin